MAPYFDVVVWADGKTTQKGLHFSSFKNKYSAAKNAKTFAIPEKTANTTLTFKLAST